MTDHTPTPGPAIRDERFTIDGHPPRTLHEYALCLDWAEERLAEANRRLANASTEREEDDQLREKMADILSRTAVALKGPEAPLTRHSWSDLPTLADLAKELAAQSLEKIAAVEAYAEQLQRERDDAEMALRMLMYRRRRGIETTEGQWAALDRIATRNASPLRQGADSPSSAFIAPSTESGDLAQQGEPRPVPSDEPQPTVQSAPATLSTEGISRPLSEFRVEPLTGPRLAGIEAALAVIEKHALAVDEEATKFEEDGTEEGQERAEQLDAVRHALNLVAEDIRCLTPIAPRVENKQPSVMRYHQPCAAHQGQAVTGTITTSGVAIPVCFVCHPQINAAPEENKHGR